MADNISRSNESTEVNEESPCLGEATKTTRSMSAPRKLFLDVAMAGWGLGTWLGINGMFVQLPLLVERLPEGWALPSSMTVAIQVGNSGMLLYALLRRLFRNVTDSAYIYGLLTISALALFLNAFLFDQIAMIGGKERSVAFLSFTFLAGLVGCTSSVLFYPYMRHFRDIYLATYLVGEGLSGFIPSILALIQGVGGEPECVAAADGNVWPVYPPPRFGIMVFMLLLTALALFSIACFTLVHKLPAFQTERVETTAAAKSEEADAGKGESFSDRSWVAVIALMVVLNAIMNGMMPSIQTYSCMPYSTVAYHLAVTLSTMANPGACLAGVWARPLPPRWLAALLAAALAPLGYMLATAIMSPTPPLVGTVGGDFLVVFTWVVGTAMISYSRMWVYGWARRGGARGMRVIGAVGQVGSITGSLTLYFLVNYAKVFTDVDVCASAAR